MKHIIISCLLLAYIGAAAAAPVACISGDELTGLTNQYKELPFVRGVTSDGRSVVVFVNPGTGSFTIAERRGQNTFCAVIVGGGFEAVPKHIQDDVRQFQDRSTL